MAKKYAEIEPRRIIRAGSEIDILSVIKFDENRFSIRIFGYEDWGGEVVDPSLVADEIDKFVPAGIIYWSPFKDKRVLGENLHADLSGQTLYGIGEYCLDLSPDRWKMHANRNTKNLWLLVYDLDTKAVRPVFVYPETYLGKYGRDALAAQQRHLGICQIRLPFADSKITDAHIRLYTKDPLVIGDVESFTTIEAPDEISAYYDGIAVGTACDGFPKLKIMSVHNFTDESTYSSVKIQLVNNCGKPMRHDNVVAYVKSSGGYLPHSQVPLDPKTGEGIFRLGRQGLMNGDRLTVKVGFKHYSAIDSKQLVLRDNNLMVD